MALAVVVVAGVAVGATAAPQTTPSWHTVPGNAIDHRALAWAAGRAWVVEGPPGGGKVVMRSARVGGTAVSGWTSTRLAAVDRWGYVGQLDDDLVWSTGQRTAEGLDVLRATRLLPNGSVGRPAEVRPRPATTYSNDSSLAAGRLGDRQLQFVDGNPNTEVVELGLCCNVNGEIVDHSSLARPRSLEPPLLGLDRKGRLWLAWSFGDYVPERFTAWMVELDRATLLPRGKATKVPSLRFATVVDLVCVDVCRLVLNGGLPLRSSKARSFTWAPGERSATAMFPPGEGTVIEARDYDGRLVVAYAGSDQEGGQLARLARGDSRGRNLRVLSSITVPQTLGTFGSGLNLTVGPIGVFGPKGFLAVTKYEGRRKYDVRVAILPLR